MGIVTLVFSFHMFGCVCVCVSFSLSLPRCVCTRMWLILCFCTNGCFVFPAYSRTQFQKFYFENCSLSRIGFLFLFSFRWYSRIFFNSENSIKMILTLCVFLFLSCGRFILTIRPLCKDIVKLKEISWQNWCYFYLSFAKIHFIMWKLFTFLCSISCSIFI